MLCAFAVNQYGQRVVVAVDVIPRLRSNAEISVDSTETVFRLCHHATHTSHIDMLARRIIGRDVELVEIAIAVTTALPETACLYVPGLAAVVRVRHQRTVDRLNNIYMVALGSNDTAGAV